MPEKQVRQKAASLLADHSLSDSDLRDKLSDLSRKWAFQGLTWFWAPQLFQRNKIVFRPFILQHFSTWRYTGGMTGFRSVPWKGDVAAALEPWLEAVDADDDIDLFQRLYNWKHQRRWTDKAIRARLVDRYNAAETTAQRQMIHDKFRIWFAMDEATACELYRKDPAIAFEFLRNRIPNGGWMEEKRQMWDKLLDLAQANGDEKFASLIYRNRIPVKMWQEDLARACDSIADPGELNNWLKDHHPAGWGLKPGDGMRIALEKRGRDVFPWFMEHLTSIGRNLIFDGNYKKIKQLAEQRQWWDLWSALIRGIGTPKEFSAAVSEQLKLSSPDIARQRLGMLSGISREYNFPGFGEAAVPSLTDKTAVELYQAFPEQVQGPFKVNIQSSAWNRFPDLTTEFIKADDEKMIDFMAGRVATCISFYGPNKRRDEIEALADYYEKLKSDPVTFADRAASALAQIPAFTIYSYRNLIKENRLARLLFERSPTEFLAGKYALGELVEAQEIHVMALAYRVLGCDDPRAETSAAECIDILLGTLLRPLQRKTRLAAFSALLNAATSEENARRIVVKAREALDLPDKKYPKEQLVGLIGKLLHRWPELREAGEIPVIYRAA